MLSENFPIEFLREENKLKAVNLRADFIKQAGMSLVVKPFQILYKKLWDSTIACRVKL